MSEVVIKVENLAKQYRLGTIGTGTLSHDINKLLAKVLGKEDPYSKVAEINDRTEMSKSDYVWALQDINFNVRRGEILGVIGKNGAGKSTLLKILSKVTGPSSGSVRMRGRVGSLLEVGTGFHPELTGRENIYLNGAILGMSKWEISRKFDEIVDFSGVAKYIDTPVKRYSSGMIVRLGFAIAAHLEPEILIVDEVLAVGDVEFQKKCLGKMKDVSSKEGRTILFVSHNLNAVRQLCTRAILIEKGMLKDQGGVGEIIDIYNRKSAIDLKEYSCERSNKDIFINKLSLIDDEGKVKNSFCLEEEFHVYVKIKANVSVSNMNFVVGICNSSGVRVFTYISENVGRTFDVKPESPLIIRLSFPRPIFCPGDYNFYISLRQGKIPYEDLFEMCPFSIKDVDKQMNGFTGGYGIVSYSPVLEVLPL